MIYVEEGRVILARDHIACKSLGNHIQGVVLIPLVYWVSGRKVDRSSVHRLSRKYLNVDLSDPIALEIINLRLDSGSETRYCRRNIHSNSNG